MNKFEFSGYGGVYYITYSHLHTIMIKLIFGGTYHKLSFEDLIWQNIWTKELHNFSWPKIEIDEN